MTGDDRDLEQALTRLGEKTTTPSEAELRELARRATDEPRPTVAGPRSRRLRLRWAVAAAAGALLVGSGLGFGLGNFVTPSGTASTPARGLGFLPAPGWTIVQGETFDVPGASRATAANVPLHPADGPNSLPARTVATLPAEGVLIHVTFEARGDPAKDVEFAPRDMPLRVEDARLVSASGAAPSRHRLRAAVGGFNVDASIYYGLAQPSAEMLAEADGQLSRLSVAAERVTLRAHPTIVVSGPVELSGEIDKPVAGEVVDIQAKDCGQQFFRGLTGTTTTGGGRWSWLIYPAISTTLRAVWDGNASAPVTIWKHASVHLAKISGGRLRAAASGGGGAAFWRKKVQIQQRKAGAWKTVKTLVLTERGGTAAYFKLRVPRGTLIRAVLPKSQAKPCFLQGVSPTLRT